jgi:hypothetical protein
MTTELHNALSDTVRKIKLCLESKPNISWLVRGYKFKRRAAPVASPNRADKLCRQDFIERLE